MAIKVGDRDLFPYLGDYGPVSIYKGEQKIAGYKWAKKSGQELHFDNTYNSFVEVEVDGKSYQHAGSGKNLYSKNTSTKGAYYHAGGWIVSSSGHREIMEDYFPISTGDMVIEQLWNPNGTVNTGSQNRIVFYDSNKAVLSVVDGIVLDGKSYKTLKHIAPNNSSFFRFGSITGVGRERDESIKVSFSVNSPPAPTPDYPIDIHSLNNFDVVSSVEKLTEGQLEEYNHGIEYENVDKINLSLSEPLRSVGDVKDRLFRDSDGLWKIERNVGEKTFNNSSGWSHHLFSDTEKDSYETKFVTTVFGQYRQIISDRFIGSLNRNPPINHIRMSSGGYLNFAVEKGMINNLSEWFSQNPFTVLYEEVPTTETLDQELQHQLNTLKSFKDSNYVYTVQNTDNPHKEQLKPTIHAKTEVKDI